MRKKIDKCRIEKRPIKEKVITIPNFDIEKERKEYRNFLGSLRKSKCDRSECKRINIEGDSLYLIMVQQGLLSYKQDYNKGRITPKETVIRMKTWNDIFYCTDRLTRKQYDGFRDQIKRLEDVVINYSAVIVDGISNDRILRIEYPKEAAKIGVEEDLKKRLRSVGIKVHSTQYKG